MPKTNEPTCPNTKTEHAWRRKTDMPKYGDPTCLNAKTNIPGTENPNAEAKTKVKTLEAIHITHRGAEKS